MTTGAVWIITKISVSSRHRKVKKYKGFHLVFVLDKDIKVRT